MGNNLDLGLLQKEKEEKSLDLCSISQLKTHSGMRQQLSEAEDRLSSLPDDILLQILSFLPLKEMGKASLLSRRWMNLWTLTPVLHFHEPYSVDLASNIKLRSDFVNWVKNVLGRHKGSSLKEFKIVFNYHNQSSPSYKTINSWLEFALCRNVQHLELELMSLGYLDSVPTVHTVYRVNFLRLGCIRKADPHGGLKCLKSLSLKDVAINDETINFLLQNSPFLERLEVAGMNELASLVISGPHLALRYLQIKWWLPLRSICISNLNLVSLNIPSVTNLTLTDLPMLVELCISETSFATSHTLSLVSCLHSQLEALTLEGLEMEELTRLSNLDRLTKLRLLVIEIQAEHDKSLTMLLSMINSCPCLEKFVFMLHCVGVKQTNTKRTVIEFERSNPSLENRTLKVFEFLGYSGRVSDAELVIGIVKSAVCLEKIIIDPCSPEIPLDPCYS